MFDVSVRDGLSFCMWYTIVLPNCAHLCEITEPFGRNSREAMWKLPEEAWIPWKCSSDQLDRCHWFSLVLFLRHRFLAVVFPVFCLVSSFPFLSFHVLFWSFNPPVSCFTLHFLYLFFSPPCWSFRPPWFLSPAACYPSLSCAVERRPSSNCDVCYPSYFSFFSLL